MFFQLPVALFLGLTFHFFACNAAPANPKEASATPSANLEYFFTEGTPNRRHDVASNSPNRQYDVTLKQFDCGDLDADCTPEDLKALADYNDEKQFITSSPGPSMLKDVTSDILNLDAVVGDEDKDFVTQDQAKEYIDEWGDHDVYHNKNATHEEPGRPENETSYTQLAGAQWVDEEEEQGWPWRLRAIYRRNPAPIDLSQITIDLAKDLYMTLGDQESIYGPPRRHTNTPVPPEDQNERALSRSGQLDSERSGGSRMGAGPDLLGGGPTAVRRPDRVGGGRNSRPQPAQALGPLQSNT